MNSVKGGEKALLVTTSLAFLSGANLYAKDFKPVIVIHGGTSGLDLTKEESAKREVVMKESLKAGQKILEAGGSSTDAVIAAIKVMEDSPEFNAGKGAVFTADGYNEPDAPLMDGKTLNAGAITMAKTIKNPIEAAKVVMEKTPHTLIVGEGAGKLAKVSSLEIVKQKYFYTEHCYKQLKEAQKSKEVLLDSDKTKAHLGLGTEPYLETVGTIVLDKSGNLAAGASTDGTTNKMTGHMGDSPIIRAGDHANNDSVAVSCIGMGDIYIRVAAAHRVAALYKHKRLSVRKAAEETIKEVAEFGGTGRIISIDKNGKVGYAWTEDKLGMYHSEARAGEEPKTSWPVAK